MRTTRNAVRFLQYPFSARNPSPPRQFPPFKNFYAFFKKGLDE